MAGMRSRRQYNVGYQHTASEETVDAISRCLIVARPLFDGVRLVIREPSTQQVFFPL